MNKEDRCEHSFVDLDNEGIYGKEVCRFCGLIRRKDGSNERKETIKTIKRHLKGIEKAVEKLEEIR